MKLTLFTNYVKMEPNYSNNLSNYNKKDLVLLQLPKNIKEEKCIKIN